MEAFNLLARRSGSASAFINLFICGCGTPTYIRSAVLSGSKPSDTRPGRADHGLYPSGQDNGVPLRAAQEVS
jgi:hypothetical protein